MLAVTSCVFVVTLTELEVSSCKLFATVLDDCSVKEVPVVMVLDVVQMVLFAFDGELVPFDEDGGEDVESAISSVEEIVDTGRQEDAVLIPSLIWPIGHG